MGVFREVEISICQGGKEHLQLDSRQRHQRLDQDEAVRFKREGRRNRLVQLTLNPKPRSKDRARATMQKSPRYIV
jgi:hypothetical protein